MITRFLLRSVASIAAALATVATAGAGSVAHAAGTNPWTSYSFVVGEGNFVRMGVVPGQPGNAHSGLLSFDSSEDPLGISLRDWNCPVGARPPTYYVDDTTCTLLRYRDGDTADTPTPDTVLTGPLNARSSALTPFVSYVDGAPTDRVDHLPVDVRWRQAGPLTRTETHYSSPSPELESRSVTLQAAMKLSGRVGWLNLADPRNNATVDYYLRYTEYDRVLVPR